MYFWVPQSGSMGLGISVLSYAGQVYFGMISDKKLLKTPERVVERFAPEFEKLLLATTVGALATKKKAARKKPRSRPAAAGRRSPTPPKGRGRGKNPTAAATT
jgi:hypothetical protein